MMARCILDLNPLRRMLAALALVCGLAHGPAFAQGADSDGPAAALALFDEANRLSDAGDRAGAQRVLLQFMEQVGVNQARADTRKTAAERAITTCRSENRSQHEALGRINEYREAALEKRSQKIDEMAAIDDMVRLGNRQIDSLITQIDETLRQNNADKQRKVLVDVLEAMKKSGRVPEGTKAPPSPKKLNDFERFFANLLGGKEQKIDVRPELQMLRRTLKKMRSESAGRRQLKWDAIGLLGQSNAYLILEADLEEQNGKTKAAMSVLNIEAQFWKDINHDWAADPTNIAAFLDEIERDMAAPLSPEAMADIQGIWSDESISMRDAITRLANAVAQHDPAVVDGSTCRLASRIKNSIDAIGRCEIIAVYPYYRILLRDRSPNSCEYQLANPPGCPPTQKASVRLTPYDQMSRQTMWQQKIILTDVNVVGPRRCVDPNMIFFGKKQSAAKCFEACRDDPDCRYWSWNERNGSIPTSVRECWGGPILSAPDLASTQTGFVSGVTCILDGINLRTKCPMWSPR